MTNHSVTLGRSVFGAVMASGIAALGTCGLIWPGIELIRALNDPSLGGPERATQSA